MKISKNFVRGDQIKNVQEVADLAEDKKSIYHKWWGIKPASVFLHMQMSCIVDLVKLGYLYRTTRISK